MKARDVMFEFSNPLMVQIMSILTNEHLRLSDIARQMSVTTAEVSRHLERLTSANIVTRGEDQKYMLTPYGKLLLLGFDVYTFFTDNEEYLMKHDLTSIPPIILSLMPLTKTKIMHGTLSNCDIICTKSEEARDFIYVMTQDVMPLVSDTDVRQAEKGVDIKKIYPEGSKIPDQYFGHENIEVRTLKNPPFLMGITDNFGGLALSDGKKIDYDFLLTSEEPAFMEWLELVFDYFWQRAKPLKK